MNTAAFTSDISTFLSQENKTDPGRPSQEQRASSVVTSSLLDFVEQPTTIEPSLVRLGENETAVVPFTHKCNDVHVHYCDAPEVKSFVVCNGPGCLLCSTGIKVEKRLLNPVYIPTAGSVGVLALPPTMSPHALLPQYLPHVNSGHRSVLFLRRQSSKYYVSARPLCDDEENGSVVIKDFMDHWEAGKFLLEDVYPHYSNELLLTIPSVASMARLKGITP